MSKGTIPERLNRMEDHQKEFAKAIDKINAKLDKQDEKLDALSAKFDELSGAKKAIIWLTGVALTITGLIIAWLNSHRS